ncbi:MAG: VWA domain-containing protein [Bacteroidetes bacterium]|nr:VWA domain-containing protein [Bacteroidota bacterium]MBU1720098.1 VWA domain-containing protein [Bacteroidota bacterium]
MIRTENFELIWLLIAIPALVAVFIIMTSHKRAMLAKFGNVRLMDKLAPQASIFLPVVKLCVAMIAVGFAVVAVMNIQVGSEVEKVKRKGVDLMIALDVSNSMLSEDIKPSRIVRAKHAISMLLSKLENDRVGLIIFAGKAYTQLPITGDYNAAKMFLGPVSTKSVPLQGTAIGSAIELAITSFPGMDKILKGEEKPDNKRNRAIIVISDGENHEDDAVELARKAAEYGISVHMIGMGTPNGAPIPLVPGSTSDFKKDRNGDPVMTKLDETMLSQIAAAGGGIYVRANNTEVGLNSIMDEIGKLDKTELESKEIKDYVPMYQPFLFVALLLLMLELAMPERNFFMTQYKKH